jgi:hypothetical protein
MGRDISTLLEDVRQRIGAEGKTKTFLEDWT